MIHTVQAYSLSTWVGEDLITYVLAPSGNMAWATISGAWGPDRHPAAVGVIHRAIGARVRTLDRGPGVRAGSLRPRRAAVEWIDGERRRSASLG